jgi:hypothetical protein
MCVRNSPCRSLLFPRQWRQKKLDGGAVMMMLESLIAFVDEVNDRPVGKPQEQGLMNIAVSFSLSNETKVINPVGKRQYSRR